MKTRKRKSRCQSFVNLLVELDVRVSCPHRTRVTDVDLQEKKPWYIILPSSHWKQAWDIVIVLLVLYNAFMIPLLMGFSDPSCTSADCVSGEGFLNAFNPIWAIVDYITDGFFWVDIILNFFT